MRGAGCSSDHVLVRITCTESFEEKEIQKSKGKHDVTKLKEDTKRRYEDRVNQELQLYAKQTQSKEMETRCTEIKKAIGSGSNEVFTYENKETKRK